LISGTLGRVTVAGTGDDSGADPLLGTVGTVGGSPKDKVTGENEDESSVTGALVPLGVGHEVDLVVVVVELIVIELVGLAGEVAVTREGRSFSGGQDLGG